MYLTEKEIFDQYNALEKTYQYFLQQEEIIKKLIEDRDIESLTFIGSGSSYLLCQSGEVSAEIYLGLPARSLAAGDLLLNFEHYREILANTLLIAPSRSGSTSEVVLAITRAKEECQLTSISICAQNDSKLSEIVDLSLEIPWAFDESVCQTRTVTNLYMSNLLLIAAAAGNQGLRDEILKAVKNGEGHISSIKETLRGIAGDNSWDKVVVLADSELQGIAAEGALAFKEISRIPADYHHILDVRHGPMVLIDEQTLVIMASSPYGLSYQQDLIKDLQQKKARVVLFGSEGGTLNADINIEIPCYDFYGVRGIPLILIPQLAAYYRALEKDINPDLPQGLDPWIEL